MHCQQTRMARPATARATAAVLLSVSAAQAIECEEGYQRVGGQLIATPYCQDENLARVARSFGMNASADRIRNNPSYKQEVCRLAGRDIRVETACSTTTGRSGRF